MRTSSVWVRSTRLWAFVFGALVLTAPERLAAQRVVYSTGFEFSEGYTDIQGDLAGHKGWVGTSGNGIVTNFFEGLGQQAYIGFSAPPGGTNDIYYVSQPINLTPAPT